MSSGCNDGAEESKNVELDGTLVGYRLESVHLAGQRPQVNNLLEPHCMDLEKQKQKYQTQLKKMMYQEHLRKVKDQELMRELYC